MIFLTTVIRPHDVTAQVVTVLKKAVQYAIADNVKRLLQKIKCEVFNLLQWQVVGD